MFMDDDEEDENQASSASLSKPLRFSRVQFLFLELG